MEGYLKMLKKVKKKEKIKIPQTITDSIPYTQVYENGIIESAGGRFSKSYHFESINFKTATDAKQYSIAELYGTFLSSFEADVNVQITLYNRTINMEDFQKEVLLDMQQDKLNEYREEYNEMLISKMTGAKNNLEIAKILTVSLFAENIIEAIEKFAQIDILVTENMTHITKKAAPPLTIEERLEILNSIYNQDSTVPLYQKRTIQGVEVEAFSLENCVAQGITTKDVIAPAGLKFIGKDIELGNTLARSYYISNYPTWLKGSFLMDFATVPANMLTSIYFNTIPQPDALKMIRRQGTNISSSLVVAQKKATRSGYDISLISPELQDAKEETNELLEVTTKENARLFVVTFVLTLFAPDRESLDRYEEQIKMIANRNLATIKCLGKQQELGFNSSLPLGYNQLDIQRLMTTQTVSALLPFDVKEVRQKKGMYYGLNAISHNMILYDRTTDLNPCGCILGMPGAGKSFASKREIINILLNTRDDVYIIDPEREYGQIAKELDGTIIKMATGSDVYINPFDMNIDNADDGGDPVKIKSDFILTICEIAIGGRYGLSPTQESIIERCVMELYEDYLKYLKQTGLTFDTEHSPTMKDFYDKLLMQPEMEAQEIALSLERYVTGAQDIFAHHTNVDINNRFVVYDIKEIGKGLKKLGLQICLDNIWNKMILNYEKGKRTWFYIDEFYLLMANPSSAAYIAEIWKRARKWGGIPTAITQNVEDMLKSEEARTVINNSSFIILLSQAPINKMQLSQLLDISPSEQKYISSAKSGMGLLRIKDNVIPFDDNFPKNTKLYQIMTTKPDDKNKIFEKGEQA